VTGSLESYDVLLRALNEYEIDTVFHLAAQTIVGTASRSALSTFESNVRGTWNLLEACRACSKLVQRVVMASSDKAYGAQRNLPYTEDMPLEGRFPYDVSKSCADLLAQSYFHTYRTPVAITRCANLFGGGDLSFNRLVPGTILSALRDQPPLIRSNGQLIRDYIDVQSAVEGYLQLAERMPEDAVVGQAFNFGYGEPVSVLELVQTILALMGKAALSPVVLNQAEHEIEEQYLDSSKAQRVLGWRPSHSREEALRETIQWYERYDADASAPSSPHIPLAT
jgi:CDP-glucose 4,6-dehydratase